MHYATGIRIANTIVWGNSAGGVNELDYGAGNAPYVSSCDVESNTTPGVPWSGNNMWKDPKFKDLELHIQNVSPCKDSIGNNNASFITDTDYDGEPRVYNNIVDIGSDEVQA